MKMRKTQAKKAPRLWRGAFLVIPYSFYYSTFLNKMQDTVLSQKKVIID